MASISANAFRNGSMRAVFQGQNLKRFEVNVGRYIYCLVLWGDGIYNASKAKPSGVFVCKLPSKMAFALQHAFRSEGFLDLYHKD